ncbi:alcohol dehydrogenase [Apiospora sp. TS-2023a]
MKAWTFTHGGYPQALHQTELPADEAPLKPTEVRVRTKAASLNPIDGQLMGFPLLGSLPGWVLPAHKGVGEDFAGDDIFGIVYFFPTGSLSETIRVDTRSPECVGLARRYVTVVGDKTSTNRLGMGGSYTYVSNPQMVWRAVLGRLGLGPSYTCINLAYKESWLREAMALPKEKIHIDSTFAFTQVREAFERLNTGRVQAPI